MIAPELFQEGGKGAEEGRGGGEREEAGGGNGMFGEERG